MLDAASSNSDGKQDMELRSPNLRRRFAIQKDKQSFCPAVLGVNGRSLICKRGPWRPHALPIAHVISVAYSAGCTASGCAGSSHSAAQEKQIHARTAVKPRWRSRAQKA